MKSLASYESQRNATLEIYDSFKKLRSYVESDGVNIEYIDSIINNLRKSVYKIAIVGKAKSGKSKFINALLGKEFLPTGILQCTSGLIEVIDSEKVLLEIQYHNDKVVQLDHCNNFNSIHEELKNIASISPDFREIPVSRINDFMVSNRDKINFISIDDALINEQKWNAKEINIHGLDSADYISLIKKYVDLNKDFASIPKRITVKFPLEYDFSEMVIVDTPGIGSIGGYDSITLQNISDADAAILIHPAKNIEDKALRDFYDKKLADKAKNSMFFFLTHGSLVKNKEDQTIILQEAKKIYSEISDRIFLVDSMLELVHQDLKAEKSFKEINLDADKKQVASFYHIDVLTNEVSKEEAVKKISEDSNFVRAKSELMLFSKKAKGIQLINVINEIEKGLYYQNSYHLHQVDLIQNKLTLSPEDFKEKIDSLKSALNSYKKKLTDFSVEMKHKYRGSRGDMATDFESLKNKYSKVIDSVEGEHNFRKYIADFVFECETKVDTFYAEIEDSYRKELDEVGSEIRSQDKILPPSISLSDLTKAAKENSIKTTVKKGNQRQNAVKGGMAGAAAGARFGPVGLLVGTVGGAMLGFFSGTEDEVSVEQNDAKYLVELRSKTKANFYKVIDDLRQSLVDSLGKFDEDFHNKINNQISIQTDSYEKLLSKLEEEDEYRLLIAKRISLVEKIESNTTIIKELYNKINA